MDFILFRETQKIPKGSKIIYGNFMRGESRILQRTAKPLKFGNYSRY